MIRKPHSKILSPLLLAKKLSRLSPAKKKSVVFTNGCFDLLHAGHVDYLDRARRLGSSLIVALNADASVRKLKGKDRPLNKLDDRMKVLSALECVDFVTWFTDDTPLKTILKIRPGILVKGGDWKTSQMVGAKEVLSWGGSVQSLNFVKGKSTTGIIQKMKK